MKLLLTENRAVDLFVTYRFLKLLVTPFEKQEAYKLGIIDKKGKNLIKSKNLETEEQRQAYTLLHRLVFNCKKILSKIPLVRTQIGTYAAALFLLKEHYNIKGMDERAVTKYLMENNLIDFSNTISEEVIGIGNMLPMGEYKLRDMVTADDDEVDAQKMKALDAFSNALADMNRAFVALAKIDQEAGNSGSGDLTDQLETVDKHIENLYLVDRRMYDIIPK